MEQVQQFSPFFAAFMAIWGAAFCKARKLQPPVGGDNTIK